MNGTNLNIINQTDFFDSLFNNNLQNLNRYGNGILNSHREAAIETFKQTGIPGKREELYKYTDLSILFNNNYKYLFDPLKIQFEIESIFKCDIPELDTYLVLLLNGFFYEYKKFENLPKGFIIKSLKKAAIEMPHLVKPHYQQYISDKNNGLIALNTAFSMDGIFIYVPKSVILDKPIQIINIGMSDEDLMIQHRNLFIFEENCQAEVIICDHSLSPGKFLTNQVTEIFCGPNAQLDITRIQNEHLGTGQICHTFIHQKRDAKVQFNNITLHGGIVRNNIYVTLAGENAENNTSGLYIIDKGQHVDNYVFVDHASPNCKSNQLFKGVLDDFSTGAFNGKILVRPGAQKTLAYQANNNILLTNDAKINTRPQLEIYADDVKCSHGATIGQLDENALFYLRSRGIGYDEAKLMMMYGFAYDVIKSIKTIPLRERIIELVDKRLRGELSRCNNCQMHCGEC